MDIAIAIAMPPGFPRRPVAGRPAIFSGQESQQLFPSPQPGAEKRRSGNFETPAAQERKTTWYMVGRLTTFFPGAF
jgi:hypothetical protein